ncbi:MAG: GNAT family N-acetyltransferase [Anaerolineae bacterium]
MAVTIRRLVEEDIEAVLDIARLAWAPVFSSLAEILGPEIWRRLDDDHQESQHKAIVELCRAGSDASQAWVAEIEREAAGRAVVVGFVACKLDVASRRGEIWFLAVHPDHQNEEIGTLLNRHALEAMREAGMTMAIVETGGDPSHAPARRSYEKAGFTALPIVRYFQVL